MHIMQNIGLIVFFIAIAFIVGGLWYDSNFTPSDPYFDPGFVAVAIGIVLMIVDCCLWSILGLSETLGHIVWSFL